MGWFSKSEPAERSDGETGKTSDAWLSIKTNDEGQPTDVIVGPANEPEHDHYWEVDQGQSGGREQVDWNKE